MDKRRLVFFLSLVLGLGVLNYPFVSQWLDRQGQSREADAYTVQTRAMTSAEKQQMLQDAYAYNRQLAENRQQLQDGFTAVQETDAVYDDLLRVQDDGVMGYIQIPAIAVELPIYHGTSTEVLQNGAGHLMQSSLPVGGADTHAVLSAHTGMADKALFTDLDQLQQGDCFTLQILDETLTYQVCAIATVWPYETDLLAIQPGRDLVTLVTCTPYGINSHRLLVTGERVKDGTEQSQTEAGRKTDGRWYWAELFFGASVLVLLAGAIFLLRPQKKGGKQSYG